MKYSFLSWIPIAVLSVSPAGGQEFRTFIGGDSTLWESPSNWNPNLVPDSITEGARLDGSATVVVGGSHTIAALEIRGGGSLSLNQSNQISTSSLSIDGAGIISGPGSLRLSTSGFINDGSGVNFSNVTFINDGTFDLFTPITLSNGTSFRNVNTTFFFDNANIGAGAGDPSIIENIGFLRKQAGTGSVSISTPIDNDLEIECTSGTLILGGNLDSSGRLRTGVDGTLTLSANHVLTDGATILGDGVTVLATGSIEIPTGATVDFDNFEMRGGLILGDGMIEYSDTDNIWASGTIAGTATSRVPSGAVLTVERQGNGPTIADSHAIEVQSGGKLSFPDDNSVITSNGTTSLMNHGTLEFGGDGDISQNGPFDNTLMAFTNAADGSVVKLAGNGDSTQFIAKVTHLGSWDIQAGKMVFQRMVDSSAPFNVASGAIVEFSGGSATPTILRSGTSFSGDGLVENSTVTEIETGAVVDVTNIDLLAGFLQGDGTLRVNQTANWKGGPIAGTATVQIQPGAEFLVDGSGSRSIGSASTPHFDNDGTFEITGTANISSNGSATFHNSGTLFLDGSADLTRNSGTNTVLTNTGTMIKEDGGQTGSSASSLMQVDLNHSGTLEVRSGELFLQGTHDISAPISVSNGATLRLDGASFITTFQPGASITGDGSVEHRSAELVVVDGARVPVDNLTTPSGSGVISGTGTLVIATTTTLSRINHQDAGTTEVPAGVTLTTGSNFRLSGGRTLHNLGEINVPVSFNSTWNDGASIANDGVIDFNTSCTINHGGGVFAIRNDGIIRCNAGGSASVNLPTDSFSGNGRIEVNSGRLRLTRPVSLTGTTVLASGTEVRGSGSPLDFAAGSTIAGTGTVVGPVTFAGQVAPGQSIGDLTISNDATFTSDGSLAVELDNGSSDRLIVAGTLDLGGLRIMPILVPGATPVDGTSWTIASAGAITGSAGMIDQSAAAAGFGFFLEVVGNDLQLSYAAVSGFQEAYEAATGLSLGPDPDLDALGEGDVDNDGLPDIFDWAFDGSLSGPDPGRRLIIDSIIDLGGGLKQIAFRYPLNPAATDVILSLEKDSELSGSFPATAFTPTGTATIDGILFQQGTVDTSATPSTTFLRFRGSFLSPP